MDIVIYIDYDPQEKSQTESTQSQTNMATTFVTLKLLYCITTT